MTTSIIQGGEGVVAALSGIDFSAMVPAPLSEFAAPLFQLPPKFEQMPEVSNGCEVIFNVPMYDYVDDGRISSGAIATLKGGCGLDLYHYLYANTKPPTKAMVSGVAIHSLIEAIIAGIGLDEFMAQYHVLPKTNRAAKDATIAEIRAYEAALSLPAQDTDGLKMQDLKCLAESLANDASGIMLSNGDYDILQRVYAELKRASYTWLSEMYSEVTIYDDVTKCRPDGLLFHKDKNGNMCAVIVSVKTTADMSRAERAAWQYCTKEAHYRYMVAKAFGLNIENVATLFLFIGTAEPCLSRLIGVSPQTALEFNQWYIAARKTAIHAVENQSFSGWESSPITTI